MRYVCPTCGLGQTVDVCGQRIDCSHPGTRFAGDGRYRSRMVAATGEMPAQTLELAPTITHGQAEMWDNGGSQQSAPRDASTSGVRGRNLTGGPRNG